METYLGGTYKLYRAGRGSGNLQEAVANWAEAVFIREIPLIIPYRDSSQPLADGFLWVGDTLNNTVAQQLDAMAPLWQQTSFFGYHDPNMSYEQPPYGTVMQMFPNAFDTGDNSRTYYVTADDVDGCCWLCAHSRGLFLKSTGTLVEDKMFPIPLLETYMAYGRYGMRSNWPFVVRTPGQSINATRMKSSMSFDTPSMVGKWWLGNVYDVYVPWDEFLKHCEWDYTPPEIDETNPWGEGSGEAPPDGYIGSDWDFLPNDAVPVPGLPPISAASTGLCSIYTPNTSDLQTLASYLWSPTFEQTILKLFSNPMEAILGLMIIPLSIGGGTTAEVKVGNVSTGVYMPKLNSQYYPLDCGTVPIPTPTKSYMDYNPFTKYWLYLPYCGTHPLSADDVAGHTLGVSYTVDVLSGACVAFVTVDGTVKYNFSGSCGVQVPITQVNYNQMISSAVSIAASIGSMVVSGGASAPIAGGAIAGTVVNGMKENVEKSGAIGGSSGLMDLQKPVLYVEYPNVCTGAEKGNPDLGQNAFEGLPQFRVAKLGKLRGYTEVEEVHLTDVPATAAELEEIESLLKSGVLIGGVVA